MSLIVPIMKPVIAPLAGGGTTLKTGLISCWEPTNATTLYDLHSNYDGTAYNTQFIGNALVFNGSSSKVYIGNHAALNPLSDRTFSIWVKFNRLNTDQGLYCKWLHNNTPVGDFLIQYDAYSSFSMNNSVLNYVVAGSTTPSYWLWTESGGYAVNTSVLHHIVIVHEWGVGAKIYIDGIDNTHYTRNQLVTTNSNSTTQVVIGDDLRNMDYSKPLNGSIYQIATWNRMLDSTELNTLNNGGSILRYSNW